MIKDSVKNNKIRLKENKTRNKAGGNIRWIIYVTALSFIISGFLLYSSSKIINDVQISIAVIFVLLIVFIGIFADMVGIAVTAADETQFHSMAAKRIKGSKLSINLIRHAHKVSSLLNDVVGDICGVISGSATAMIVAYLAINTKTIDSIFLGILFSGAVAGLTIGGKAVGKTKAMKYSNNIVYRTACIITLVYPEKWEKKCRKNGEKKT